MIDPPRLKFASRRPISRVLLESALEDHSAPGAAERALQALSVGSGVVATALAVKASASTSIGSQWVGLVVVKWLGLGLVVGAGTLVSAEYAVEAISARSHAAVAATAPRRGTPITQGTPNARLVMPASPPPVSPDALGPEPALPEATRAPRNLAPAAEASVQVVEPAAAPLNELRAIRAALHAHAPARALLLVEAFERQHPGSSFSEETAVLRIDALIGLGRSSDARAAGQDFLRSYPHSAYAERVRSQLRLP
jgi:hypothetical protein